MIPVGMGQQEQAERQIVISEEPEQLPGIRPRVEGNGLSGLEIPSKITVDGQASPVRGEPRHLVGQSDLAGMIVPASQLKERGNTKSQCLSERRCIRFVEAPPEKRLHGRLREPGPGGCLRDRAPLSTEGFPEDITPVVLEGHPLIAAHVLVPRIWRRRTSKRIANMIQLVTIMTAVLNQSRGIESPKNRFTGPKKTFG